MNVTKILQHGVEQGRFPTPTRSPEHNMLTSPHI